MPAARSALAQATMTARATSGPSKCEPDPSAWVSAAETGGLEEA